MRDIIIRNDNSIVCFTVTNKYKQTSNGLKMIRVYMNSSNIFIKPYKNIQNNTEYTQLHIQCYGGGL